MYTSIKVSTGDTINIGQPVGITLNKTKGILKTNETYTLQFKIINYSSINKLDYIYIDNQKLIDIEDISIYPVVDTVNSKNVYLCHIEFISNSKKTNPVIKIGRNMVDIDTPNTLIYEITDFQLERGYKTEYKPHSNDLGELKSNLESKINLLADSLQFYVAKNDFDNLGNTVSSALGQIEVSTGEISLKVEQTDIDNAKNELEGSIDKKISNAKAEIKMTTDSISQRVSSTESTTSTLSNKVTVVESTANTANSNATSALNKANSATTTANSASTKADGAVSTANTAKSTADKAQTTANSANALANTANNTANTNKNNITTLQTTVTTTNNKVAELTTNLDGITQRVSSTESKLVTTTNKLDNLKVGGTNLLPNTKTFNHWNLGTGKLLSDTYLGFNIYYQDYKASSGVHTSDFACYSGIEIEPNTQYTLSFYVKGVGKFHSYLYPNAIIKAENCKGNTWSSTNPSDGGIINIINNPDTWERFWVTWNSGTNVSGKKSIIVARQNVTQGDSELYICGVKLEKGNKATDWQPSPQDIDSSIASVDSKVQTTNNKVASIETNLNGITQRVSSTESTTSTLTTKVNTAQSTANTANTQANTNKNNISSLTTTVSNTNNKVSSLETNLSAITSRVSATETNLITTTNKLNDLKVGGTNLLRDTRTLANWGYIGFSLQTGHYDGTMNAVYINYKSSSGVNYYDFTRGNAVWVEPNTEYTLSFWAKGTGKFFSYLYGASGGTVASGYNSSGGTTTGSDGAIVTTLKSAGQWQRYWITWKTNSSVKQKVHIIPCRVAQGLGDCEVLMCGVKLERGNKSTEWSPSSEDIETSVSNLTTRVSNAESKLTKDSLTTTIGNHYTTSTDVNGIVTSKGYATTSQVQQTKNELTATFTETGGYNLIKNSTGNGGSAGWVVSSGQLSRATHAPASTTGNSSFLYLSNTSLTTSEIYAHSSRFALKGNTKYTLSGWFYMNPNVKDYDIFVLTSNSLDADSTSLGNTYVHHSGVKNNTGWQFISFTFTTPSDVKSGFVRIDNNGYNGNGTTINCNVHWCSLMLNEGSIALPWTPHPSEIYEGITKIDKDGITVTQSNAKTKTTMSTNGFAITRTDKNADIFKVGSNGLLTLNGVFKCYKDGTNMSGARLESSGAIMFGYNSDNSTSPVFASGLWTNENRGYFSVGYTRADYSDENGCLWMSPQENNNGGELTFSKKVDNIVKYTSMNFNKDGSIDFTTDMYGKNDTDDTYTYRFNAGISTKALRCDNIRTNNIYPRNTGTHNIGSPTLRFKDVYADSLTTTSSYLNLGTVTSSGSWETYGALSINSKDGYVFPLRGNGQISMGMSNARFYRLYTVTATDVSSDKRCKTDIHYLGDTYNPSILDDRLDRNMNITAKDMYDFVKDDLKLASYRYNVNLERGDTSVDYGFIAQDILYTKVGSEIVQLEDKSDLNSNLSYNQGNYIAALAGALQEAIKKIEVLENKIKELELK